MPLTVLHINIDQNGGHTDEHVLEGNDVDGKVKRNRLKYFQDFVLHLLQVQGECSELRQMDIN